MLTNQIDPSQFRKIGLSNEFWLWMFVPKNLLGAIEIQPVGRDEKELVLPHFFKNLINKTKIPVFESYVEDSIDFLLSCDPNVSPHFKKHNDYPQVLIAYNNCRLVSSTMHPKMCYCPQGVIELIGQLNVNYLLDLDLS